MTKVTLKGSLLATFSVLLLAKATSANAGGYGQSNGKNSFYNNEFLRDLNTGVANEDLKRTIKDVLKNHINVGYGRARVFLMGQFYLVNQGNQYAVKDVYCDRLRTQSEFPGKSGLGPDRIPDDKVVNTEHTWPQSRFNGGMPKDEQKSDLHHLFPTDSQLNGIRGNKKFGEVTQDAMELKCRSSRYGSASYGGDEVFEPPQDHKGNVSRALFYFSVKYNLKIDKNEEETLRKWAKEDPIDEEELRRNEEIEKVQASRNPFIDYPELSDRISDF